MYENIVNSLRYCAENDCSPKCPKAGTGKGCIAGLKREAADAIEELSRKIESLESMREIPPEVEYAIDKHADNLIFHMDELISELEEKLHWIPPDDCLPMSGEEIITLGPNGGIDCGYYKGLSGTQKDKWNWKKNTVKTVKFWMPRKALPEQPKEET